jgi:hypothetical protein
MASDKMHFAAKVLLRVPTYGANISHDPPRLVAAGGKLETSKARGNIRPAARCRALVKAQLLPARLA